MRGIEVMEKLNKNSLPLTTISLLSITSFLFHRSLLRLLSMLSFFSLFIHFFFSFLPSYFSLFLSFLGFLTSFLDHYTNPSLPFSLTLPFFLSPSSLWILLTLFFTPHYNDSLSKKEFEEGQDDMAFVTSPEADKITIANDVITLPDFASAKSRLSVRLLLTLCKFSVIIFVLFYTLSTLYYFIFLPFCH